MKVINKIQIIQKSAKPAKYVGRRFYNKIFMVDSMASELNRIWDYIWRWYPWVKELEQPIPAHNL